MKTLLRILVTALVLMEVVAVVRVLDTPTAPEASPIVTEQAPEPVSFSEHCRKAAPSHFDVFIRAAAFEFGVDPRILATTVYRESACNPKALGSSGEIGLAQVHPKVWTKTLAKNGIIRRARDLWDPYTNLRASAWILSKVSESAKGDLHGTFRRYNGAGPAARKYASEQVEVFATLWTE